MLFWRVLAFVALSALCGTSLAAAAMADQGTPVDFRWGVKILLRDGVKLAATLYRPQGQTAPLPCVFTLTHYIAQSYQIVACIY